MKEAIAKPKKVFRIAKALKIGGVTLANWLDIA
jgi:hypothetical protein